MTDRFEFLCQLKIREAQDSDAFRFQIVAAPSIVTLCGIRKVAVAIHFDNQHRSRAVEVRDVVAERLLPAESERQIAQKFKPKLALVGSRVVPQPAGGLP